MIIIPILTGKVWTIYFRIWLAGSSKLDSSALVDTTLMNHALFAEFLTETLPQLALQGKILSFTTLDFIIIL